MLLTVSEILSVSHGKYFAVTGLKLYTFLLKAHIFVKTQIALKSAAFGI